jgi:hypothetical protein
MNLPNRIAVRLAIPMTRKIDIVDAADACSGRRLWDFPEDSSNLLPKLRNQFIDPQKKNGT